MKITLALAISLLSLTAHAQSISLKDIGFGGSGCKPESTSISPEAGQTDFTLVTDGFVVETGGTTNRALDRASCAVAVPVAVPEGYQAALTSEVTGYVHAERKAQVLFQEEIFKAGSTGEVVSRPVRGPHANSFEVLYDESRLADSAWTECGESTNLRANLQLRSQGEAIGAIYQVHFNVIFRRCR